MKSLVWILVGALVVAVGTPWLRGPRSDGDGSLGLPTTAQGVRAEAGLTDARREVGPASRGPERPALAPRLVLERELWAVLGSGDPDDQDRERQLLADLVAEGSASALSAAVEAVADERSIWHSDPVKLELLFRPAPGTTRLFHLVQRRVDSLGASGQANQAAYVRPWFYLAAVHGGERGGRWVAQHIGAVDAAIGKAAAGALGDLGDLEGARLLLAAQEMGGLTGEVQAAISRALTTALAGVQDPQQRAALFEQAFDGAAPVSRRATLLAALGPFIDQDQLGRYVQLFRTSSDAPSVQQAVIEGLRGVRAGEALTDGVIELQVGSFALELIGDPDETRARCGALLVRDVDALHGMLMVRGALEARLAGGTSGTLAGMLKSALAALDG
jgi:hypothetical protein